MGAISRFDLGSIVDQFGMNAYIETGVGMGVSLSHAARFFDDVRGCEGSRDSFLRFSARTVNESLRRRLSLELLERRMISRFGLFQELCPIAEALIA